MIVSNIGTAPGFSSIYTTNSGSHTAFIQVSLKEEHKTGSYEYMARVKERIQAEMPELSAYFSSGGMVDAVLNLGLPAPIDVQVAGTNMKDAFATANRLAAQIRRIDGVADVFIPQDIDYPALRLDVDRTRAGQLGLDQREVVGNLITALTSNQMIAPSYWIDPKNGNDYMLTVQYPENQVRSISDLRAIPLRGTGSPLPTRLDAITRIDRATAPDRGGPLPAPAHDRHLRAAARGGPRTHRELDRQHRRRDKSPRRVGCDAARDGARHARVFQKLRARACASRSCSCT